MRIRGMKIDINKKIIFGLVILGALVAAIFIIYALKGRIIAKEFAGQIEKIENNAIFTKGNFIVEGHNEFLLPDKSREVKIIVASETKIIKTLLYLPTIEELEKTGGIYYPENLKQENKDVDLDTLKKDLENSDIGIRAKASENILNKSEFTVQEISYIEPVYP